MKRGLVLLFLFCLAYCGYSQMAGRLLGKGVIDALRNRSIENIVKNERFLQQNGIDPTYKEWPIKWKDVDVLPKGYNLSKSPPLEGIDFTLTMPSFNSEALYWGGRYSLAKGDTVQAMKSFREAAQKGNPGAQYEYGKNLLLGNGVKQNQKEAWKWINKAASNNNKEALWLLGHHYYFGVDLPKDTIQGLQLITKAADKGMLDAQFQVANIYFVQTDYENAFKYYMMVVDSLHRKKGMMNEKDSLYFVKSCFDLGCIKYYGQGIEQDYATAKYFWELTIPFEGDGEISYNIGCMLLSMAEDEKDVPNARYLMKKVEGIMFMKKAAKSGFSDAQSFLGNCYMKGDGVRKDSLEAIQWYKKAAESGHTGAQYCLTLYYSKANDNDSTILWGNSPGCRDSTIIQYCMGRAYYQKKDIDNSIIWWKKAAEKQNMDACYLLFTLYKKELNDSPMAFNYLTKAVELGHVEAICEMGVDYFIGEDVEKNEEKGIEYLKRAAECGNSNAYFYLGNIYSSKEYKRKDIQLAAEYWKQGAELGSAECQYYYGMLLKKGKGVKKDKEKAIYWIKQAAQNGSNYAIKELEKLNKR